MSITTGNAIIKNYSDVMVAMSLYIKASDCKKEKSALNRLKYEADYFLEQVESEIKRLEGQEAGSCE